MELLLQRLGLESDEDDPEEEREEVRIAWLARITDLGLEGALLAEERAFLELAVGAMNEEQVDDVEGRVICGLVLLWALRRIGERPSAKMLGDATRLITEYGILSGGSISGANATAASVELRPEGELREAHASYIAKHADGDPEQMVSVLASQTLEWILESSA